MTWIKIDDQLYAHPKVLRAWHAYRPSLGLHMLALSHCAAYLTDGHVSEPFVKSQLSGAPGRRAVAALVEAGLWEQSGSGWVIHDYLAFNKSRDQVLKERAELSEQRAEAGRKGAAARLANRLANGQQTVSKTLAPTPTPDPFPSLRPSVAESAI